MTYIQAPQYELKESRLYPVGLITDNLPKGTVKTDIYGKEASFRGDKLFVRFERKSRDHDWVVAESAEIN